MFLGRPSVRPCVNAYVVWRDISELIGQIAAKLNRSNQHVSGHANSTFKVKRQWSSEVERDYFSRPYVMKEFQ